MDWDWVINWLSPLAVYVTLVCVGCSTMRNGPAHPDYPDYLSDGAERVVMASFIGAGCALALAVVEFFA